MSKQTKKKKKNFEKELTTHTAQVAYATSPPPSESTATRPIVLNSLEMSGNTQTPVAEEAHTEKTGNKSAQQQQPPHTTSEHNLSPADLKKKAKLEKQARRAREKAEREPFAAGGPSPAKKGGGNGKEGGHKQQLPIRRGGAQQQSQTPPAGGATTGAAAAGGGGVERNDLKLNKNVAVFGHLYGQQRRTSIAGAGKEVHPAVLALGLQMRDYVVCGSSARCLAMLFVFKRVCHSLSSGRYSANSVIGDPGIYNPSRYLSTTAFDDAPISSNHLSIYMSTSFHQPGECHSFAQAGHFQHRPVGA